jgi:hypothetical protein
VSDTGNLAIWTPKPLSSQEDINGEKLTDERVKETPEQGSGDKCFLKSPTPLFQL